MGLISKDNTFATDATIVASEHNANFDEIYNEFNGNIDNNNIKSGAGIVDTKLAQVTTASKVHGTAITGLASVPSGAGRLPTANLATTGVFDAVGLTEQSDSVSTGAGQGKIYTKETDSQSELYFRTDSAGDEVQITSGGNVRKPFGTWTTKTADDSHLAATDGFVVAYESGTADHELKILTDSSNPPTTVRQRFYKTGDGTAAGSVMCPVKSGDYFKVTDTGTSTIYWLPLA